MYQYPTWNIKEYDPNGENEEERYNEICDNISKFYRIPTLEIIEELLKFLETKLDTDSKYEKNLRSICIGIISFSDSLTNNFKFKICELILNSECEDLSLCMNYIKYAIRNYEKIMINFDKFKELRPFKKRLENSGEEKMINAINIMKGNTDLYNYKLNAASFLETVLSKISETTSINDFCKIVLESDLNNFSTILILHDALVINLDFLKRSILDIVLEMIFKFQINEEINKSGCIVC